MSRIPMWFKRWYDTGHMQCRTRKSAPVSTHAELVRYCTTLLACMLTRACVLLKFACAHAHRVVKNFIQALHHGHRWLFYTRGLSPSISLISCDLESCSNLGLIPDLIPAIPVYQIRLLMRFYGHAPKFTRINEFILDSRIILILLVNALNS